MLTRSISLLNSFSKLDEEKKGSIILKINLIFQELEFEKK